ncbi:hypothetical protein FFLO_00858 [Filobasidium floriforme]|uniref:Uncharacterized protein n=1 Tax=Filobasidium floriforme TaxID=5210 RepID=A0A8K0JQP2_9TREE|nr:uncharacterized protein HD553DRAFT_309045 [Filobasidium floriforme]KAG7571185.1 hypothetical protein FFLO_00858 [Filobasidium floriforme]KAH8087024.1 hypothetical protein HD553DRAFT_309045 [Filobasidium floriforme]
MQTNQNNQTSGSTQRGENKAPNPFMENNANTQNIGDENKAAPTFLHKKGLLGRGGAKAGQGRGGFLASPTDNLMSPVTAKLNNSKQRHFMKGKPTTLFPSALGKQDNTGGEASKENNSPF